MEGEEGKQQPHLALAHKLFLLNHPDVADLDKVRLKEEVFEAIKADGSRTRLEICCLFDIFLRKLVGKVGAFCFMNLLCDGGGCCVQRWRRCISRW